MIAKAGTIAAAGACLFAAGTAMAGPLGADPSSAIVKGMIGAAAASAALSQPRETYDSAVNAETSRATVQSYSPASPEAGARSYQRTFSTAPPEEPRVIRAPERSAW